MEVSRPLDECLPDPGAHRLTHRDQLRTDGQDDGHEAPGKMRHGKGGSRVAAMVEWARSVRSASEITGEGGGEGEGLRRVPACVTSTHSLRR